MRRVLAQESGSQTHKVVQTAGSLQCGCCRDYRHDDEHHIDRQIARLQTETEHKDEHAHHAVDAESDAADTCTFEYESQYNGKL